MKASESMGAALNALVGHLATVEHDSCRAWRSITFSGERHQVRLRFTGIEAAIEGEALIEEIGEVDTLSLAGRQVVDIAVTTAERTALAGAPDKLVLTVEISVLTLDLAEAA